MKGYTGNILHVDLSRGDFELEHPDEVFYRTYLGGSCLGAYYLLKDLEPGTDALAPENIMVFAASPLTGAAVSGASRHSVTTKSPLTGTIASSEAGGYWGPELKFAGFDAIVVSGKASSPVYLRICDGEFEIKSAENIWGMVTKDAQEAIWKELGDRKNRFAMIGPAGENLVKYACIANDLKHFNGRNGMGAVMGSKNLKAIAVRGTRKLGFADPDFIGRLARKGVESIRTGHFFQDLRDIGTNMNVEGNAAIGGLPTRNWSSGHFEDFEKISGKTLFDTIRKGPGTCWSCAQSCKRIVEIDGPIKVDPAYGGPEYETVGMCGSNLGINDLTIISKINEICNKHTMDTISFGGTVGFAMECFEKGIISIEDCDGMELRFGSGETVLELAEKTAKRKGFGAKIAEGTAVLAKEWGSGSEKFAVTVKSKEFPAHMPQLRPTLGLAYALVPFGSDHVSSFFDPAIASSDIDERLVSLGFSEPVDPNELSLEKARYFWYTQRAFSLFDTLCVCVQTFNFSTIYGPNDLVNLLNAATGWNTNLFELFQAGERRIQMFRLFNEREGFGIEDDSLPPRLFEPLKDGVSDGVSLNKVDFIKAREYYYDLLGWDKITGKIKEYKKREFRLGGFK